LKHFRPSVTIPRVTKHFKQLLKGAAKKSQIWYENPDF